MTLNEKDNWKSIVDKAIASGYKEVPVSASLLEIKILQLFKDTKIIMSAKVVFDALGEKEQKFFSDKLWYMARKGQLKCVARGFYKLA